MTRQIIELLIYLAFMATVIVVGTAPFVLLLITAILWIVG